MDKDKVNYSCQTWMNSWFISESNEPDYDEDEDQLEEEQEEETGEIRKALTNQVF